MNDFALRLDLVSRLLAYPLADYHERVKLAREAWQTEAVAGAEHLDRFARAVRDRSTEDLEELYTHTFDLNPQCALEVGWHLYGENYARGEFLVMMRRELRRHGLPETCDLPDHLTHVLAVLGRLETDRSRKLTNDFVLPAMAKMLAGLRGKNNPYEHLLVGIRNVLAHRFAQVTEEASHV